MVDLYISFSNLAYAMKSGNVKPSDLEGALFGFGYSRTAFEPNDVRDVSAVCVPYIVCTNEDIIKGCKPESDEDLAGAQMTYDTIRSAVFNAEKEGRAMFEVTDYSRLNRLLMQNGIDTSSVKDLEGTPGPVNRHVAMQRYDGLVNTRIY